MAKNKFDILNSDEAKEVVNDAVLKEATPSKETVNFSIKGFPKDVHDAINASDDNVNAFVRRACRKLAKEEGLL